MMAKTGKLQYLGDMFGRRLLCTGCNSLVIVARLCRSVARRVQEAAIASCALGSKVTCPLALFAVSQGTVKVLAAVDLCTLLNCVCFGAVIDFKACLVKFAQGRSLCSIRNNISQTYQRLQCNSEVV